MKLKQLIAGAAIVGGLGLTAIGLGVGVATADPPPPWQQGPPPSWQQGPPPPPMPGGPPPAPFDYHGQQVNPMFDQVRSAWGFWFLGTWIPL